MFLQQHLRVTTILAALTFTLNATNAKADDGLAGTNAPSQKTEVKDFAKLRSELLTMIGGASSKIWLSTSFLSDGEVVSSLFIAQYRKVNVQVLLGRANATNVFSRLSYLKQVNIPVSITPNNFYPKFPTIILIDNKLIVVNSSMNNLEKMRSFTISLLAPSEIPPFEAAFVTAANETKAPNAAPLPLVGRMNARPLHKSGFKPLTNSAPGTPIRTNGNDLSASQNPPADSAPRGTTSADGSYHYSNARERPGTGVITKLPKSTIIQERMRSRGEGGQGSATPPMHTP
jgi:hypothetical protein